MFFWDIHIPFLLFRKNILSKWWILIEINIFEIVDIFFFNKKSDAIWIDIFYFKGAGSSLIFFS